MNFKVSPTIWSVLGLTISSVGLATATNHIAGFLIPFGIGIIILAIIHAVNNLD